MPPDPTPNEDARRARTMALSRHLWAAVCGERTAEQATRRIVQLVELGIDPALACAAWGHLASQVGDARAGETLARITIELDALVPGWRPQRDDDR